MSLNVENSEITMCLSNKMCYTCLSTDTKDLVSLSDADLDKIPYIDKIKYCLSAELIEYDSREICPSCIPLLRSAYQFIEMVKVSQKSLRNYLEKSKSSNVETIKIEYLYENLNNTEVKSEIDIKDLYNDLKSESNCGKRDEDSDSSDYFLSDLKDEEENSYTCKKCGKFTKTLQEYHKHRCKNIANSNEEKESSFDCDFCHLSFKKQWMLQKHRQRFHLAERKYVCTYCNKSFKQSSHLSEHVRAHTGEKNYACTFCDKKFHRISSQRRHIKTHQAAPGHKTKRTPFLCSICGKSFPFSNGVQRHMRIHLGIKSHECSVCKKKFSQTTHLHVHMRTHTGEKPYICDICGEAFSLNASLQKHMAVHQSGDRNATTNEYKVYLT